MDVLDKERLQRLTIGYFIILFLVLIGLWIAKELTTPSTLKYYLIIYEACARTVLDVSFCIVAFVLSSRFFLMTIISTGLLLGFKSWVEALTLIGNPFSMKVMILPPRIDPWYANHQYHEGILLALALITGYFFLCETLGHRDYMYPIKKTRGIF